MFATSKDPMTTDQWKKISTQHQPFWLRYNRIRKVQQMLFLRWT